MDMTPCILLLCGLPGTGKSTVAKHIHKRLGWPVLSTENFRARLFDYASSKDDVDFTEEELRVVYKAIALTTEMLISHSSSVIVEGVFRSTEQRKLITELELRCKARCMKVVLYGNDGIIRDRLIYRKNVGDVAPAGPKSYAKIKRSYEPVDPDYLAFDTTSDSHPNDIAEEIVKKLI